MLAFLCFGFAILALPFKSKIQLEAENTALRHQLIVVRRQVRGRVRFKKKDRLLFIQLYRWFPSILKVFTVIRPKTLVALASGRLFLLLALEIALAGRAAADRDGPACTDPADEH